MVTIFGWKERKEREEKEEKKTPLFAWKEIEEGKEKWREQIFMGLSAHLFLFPSKLEGNE